MAKTSRKQAVGKLWPADKVERRPIGSLIPYAKNARTHSDAQIALLARSMEEFGFTNPVLIDETGGILCGHGRVLAAHLLGWKEVSVMIAAGWTKSQKQAYIIADNRLAEIGSEWNPMMLSSEFDELMADGFDVDLTGFSKDDILDLMPDEKDPRLTDENEVPDVPLVPVSRQRDIWLLSNHRLACGDATDPDSCARLMQGKVASCVWTDPPYNVSYIGKTKSALKIKNDAMGDLQFYELLRDSFILAMNHTGAGGGIYITYPDRQSRAFHNAFADDGWKLSSVLVWVKNSLVLGRSDYHSRHEPLIYGWKDGAPHTWLSDRSQDSVLEFNRPSQSIDHPTMKPVELIEYCISNNTRKGAIILDIFGGSGSTLIACEKIGRQSRIVEIDPCYCDVIVKRWQDFTGKLATLEGDGRTFAEIDIVRKKQKPKKKPVAKENAR